MLKFVCDKCGVVISEWKEYKRVEVSFLTQKPDETVSIGDMLRTKSVFDLCKRCYKKLGLE